MPRTTEVARRAGVNAQTIRNYASEFAALLSPAASVTHGTRVFTDEDMAILCAIADLRRVGASHDEIVRRVRDNEVPPIIDVSPQTPSNSPQPDSTGASIALQTPQEARHDDLLLPVVISNHEARLQALERQVHSGASWAITWAIIGAGIMLVAVAVALYFG